MSCCFFYFAILADFGEFPVGMKGFGKPHFSSLREPVPFGLSGGPPGPRSRSSPHSLQYVCTCVNSQFSIFNFQLFYKKVGG